MEHRKQIGAITFGSKAELPSDEDLLRMLEDFRSSDRELTYGIPTSLIFSDKSDESGFYEKFQKIVQDAGEKYPIINAIEELPSSNPEYEAEMNAFWLSTPEHDAAIKAEGEALAKSLGLM